MAAATENWCQVWAAEGSSAGAPSGVDVAMARAGAMEATSSQKLALVQHMSIQIDSCSAREKIVVTTRSSVYELVILRGDRGSICVRGGRHFPKFRRALF